MVDTCHCVFVQVHRIYNTRNEPWTNVNLGLWVVIMYQRRFLSCKKCTTLGVGVLIMGEAICVGVRALWGTSITSSQFCCEPETALKNKVY